MLKKIISLVLCSCLVTTMSLTIFAHSGRTDANGGHRDNKNVSGLGYYHYHHGYPAHLHPNGVCPYLTVSTPSTYSPSSSAPSTNSSNSKPTQSPSASTTKNGIGWLTVEEKKYWHNYDNNTNYTGFQKIEDMWYYFGTPDYSAQTGWIKINKKIYYFGNDCTMVTGSKKIGNISYVFNKFGVLQKGNAPKITNLQYTKAKTPSNLNPKWISDNPPDDIFLYWEDDYETHIEKLSQYLKEYQAELDCTQPESFDASSLKIDIQQLKDEIKYYERLLDE